ncbi:inorganic pyrophosphatase [Pseudobutyrivibrio sp. JW11]|uniref:inorganic diphosphatase n=1 Tax=Pseudobutyrivibrio sp. JW11 TaxID=1855302 RepID=UPI0008E640C6|nr:inorganic diphosphatase [Pseudobutyrivibrio sp. JW11]SFO64501.1 inorganic pyrophosphatase [Pseudobutyrivibrio sp. JW11]
MIIEEYKNIIGSIVTGTVDRPLGSAHPNYPDMIYPINYGYVDGVFAPDGEEQDVYIFGADEPLDTYAGTVIAVYHRINDNEDKWIVSIDGKDYSDDEILEKIDFQEKYYKGILLR